MGIANKLVRWFKALGPILSSDEFDDQDVSLWLAVVMEGQNGITGLEISRLSGKVFADEFTRAGKYEWRLEALERAGQVKSRERTLTATEFLPTAEANSFFKTIEKLPTMEGVKKLRAHLAANAKKVSV